MMRLPRRTLPVIEEDDHRAGDAKRSGPIAIMTRSE